MPHVLVSAVSLVLALQPLRVGSGVWQAAQDPAPTSERKPIADGLRELPVDELVRGITDVWTRAASSSRGQTLTPEASELYRRLDAGELADADWRRLLEREGVFHTRRQWPAGEPLGLWIRPPAWLPGARIRVVAVEPPLGSVTVSHVVPSTCGNCSMSRFRSEQAAHLKALPPGTKRIVLQVEVQQSQRMGRIGGLYEPLLTRWSGAYELPVTAVATAGEAMPARAATEIDAVIGAGLSVGHYTHGGVLQDHPLIATLWADRHGVLEGLVPGARYELVRDGVVRDQGSLKPWFEGERVRAWIYFNALPQGIAGDPKELSRWELRLHGDARDALACWAAESWWRGELQFPLAELLAREKQPK